MAIGGLSEKEKTKSLPRTWTGVEHVDGLKIKAVISRNAAGSCVLLSVFDPDLIFSKPFKDTEAALTYMRNWCFDNHVELEEVV